MCNDKNDLGNARGSGDSKYYYIDFYIKESYFEHRYYGGSGTSGGSSFTPIVTPVIESGYQWIDANKIQVQKTSTSKNPTEEDHANARIYMKVVIDSTRKSENKEVELQFYEDSAFTSKFVTLWMGNASTHSAMNSSYQPTQTGVNRIKIWDQEWRNQPLTMKIYQGNTFPTLSFDGYNKLSFSNIAPMTSNVTFDGNTYSIGTASNVYIENTGTYESESKGTTTFALMSNVVNGPVTYKPSSTVDAGNFTLAFRHGSGTTDTSTNNCTLYSSLTAGEYDWGTVNSVSSTSTETTYNVTFGPMTNIEYLVLAGGGGGSNDYPGGGGGWLVVCVRLVPKRIYQVIRMI